MYEKSNITIANILGAAEERFIAKNYNDVTMSEIAERAQVTKGALYHHFSGKESLYLTMMHSYLEEIGAMVVATAVSQPGTARNRLHNLAYSFLKLPINKQKLMRLVRRDINIFKDPMRTELVRAYQKTLPEKAEAIIRDGILANEIAETDARLLAWEYVALVEVVLGDYARQVLGGAAETADYVMNLFFNGAASK